MGCNFYTIKGIHIGKRSASGMYCWDCRLTLCKEGESGIHYGASEWFKSCPKCGMGEIVESFESSSVGRELGFNREKPKEKNGVKSCSSFSWAIEPEKLKPIRKIKDEYGHKYTKKEFEQVLTECPVRYSTMIGKEFS